MLNSKHKSKVLYFQKQFILKSELLKHHKHVQPLTLRFQCEA